MQGILGPVLTDGNSGIVVTIHLDPSKGINGRMYDVMRKLSISEKFELNWTSNCIKADLRQLYDLVNYSDVRNYNSIIALKYALQRRYPSFFGKEEEHCQEFDAYYGDDFYITEFA